jgi:release factor glutamine methyltransferase
MNYWELLKKDMSRARKWVIVDSLFTYRFIFIACMTSVYRPAEDSELLLRHARPRFRGSVLDIGTGSGFLTVEAASDLRVDRVVAVDIDPEALDSARSRAGAAEAIVDIEFVLSDLFEALEGERFDLIMFNPPYLPSEGDIDEPSWSGGKKGNEIILRFLDEASEHLNPDGDVLMIYSSESGLTLVDIDEKYSATILEELPLFFERLYCVLLKPL